MSQKAYIYGISLVTISTVGYAKKRSEVSIFFCGQEGNYGWGWWDQESTVWFFLVF